MSMPKIGGIAGLILVGFILNVVSVFTDGWIVYSVKTLGVEVSSHYGIVPFHSSKAAWFNIASWCMFISFAAYIILLVALANALRLTRDHGCSHSIRHAFHTISGICSLVGILEAIAFLIFAIKASSASDLSSSMGYSAYLDLVSLILTFVAGGLSAHVSYHDCC